jgi:hypothetical protein
MSNIRWRSSLDEALNEAKSSGKLTLLDVFNPG